jgi:hypothetical protein
MNDLSDRVNWLETELRAAFGLPAGHPAFAPGAPLALTLGDLAALCCEPMSIQNFEYRVRNVYAPFIIWELGIFLTATTHERAITHGVNCFISLVIAHRTANNFPPFDEPYGVGDEPEPPFDPPHLTDDPPEPPQGGASDGDSPNDPNPPAPTGGPRYELIRELGRGSMGVVYLAREVKYGIEVAVKAPSDDFLFDHSEDAFLDEGRNAARVPAHPNVCAVLGVWRDADDRLYIVMERMRGSLLDLVNRRGRAFGVAEVAAILRDVFTGLRAVHASGIVHRDLKPANVLMRDGGKWVVADFGIARPHGATGYSGTPRYMAPEVRNGEAAGPPADVFSVGVMALQFLTGDAHAENCAEPLARACATNHHFGALLTECLAPNPADRPSVDELIVALEPHCQPGVCI